MQYMFILETLRNLGLDSRKKEDHRLQPAPGFRPQGRFAACQCLVKGAQ